MLLGAATVDITPTRNLLLGGGMFGKATGTNDPLTATAFCFQEDGRRILLIGCDLIGFNNGLADSLRADIAAATGIPREAIALSATHTHSGPVTLDLRHWGASDASYARFLRKRLTAAAVDAAAKALPARLRWSSGQHRETGVNRTSYGVAVDATLAVLRVEHAGDGRLLGLVVNHGCHPVTMHGTRVFSADFPGALRREVRRVSRRNVPVIFLLGAAGDINPSGFEADLSGKVTPELMRSRRTLCRRIGAGLARRALAGAARCGKGLAFRVDTVRLPLKPYPDPAARRSLMSSALADIRRYANDPAKAWPLAEALVMRDWLKDAASRKGAKSLPLEVQALRIGAMRILALPVELFAAPGMELRRAAGRGPLMVATMCNGYNSYVTVDASVERGTYEAAGVPRLLGRQAYARGAGRRLVAGATRAIRLLERESG